MGSTRKKVIVRLLSGELDRGYLPPSDFAPDGEAELLQTDGRIRNIPLAALKHIAFVNDFNPGDSSDPERLSLRSFPSRPRGVGLWVRVAFPEGDNLEGLVHAGLSLLDSILLERGVFLEPPGRRGNTQRLFVPRSALVGFEVLGMAGSGAKGGRPVARATPGQGDLFKAMAGQ